MDLHSFGLPGTGTTGDLKVYIADFNRRNGKAAIDIQFRDELTGETGVNFNRSVNYSWPGARGKAGAAKPHAMIFVKGAKDKKGKEKDHDHDEKEDD